MKPARMKVRRERTSKNDLKYRDGIEWGRENKKGALKLYDFLNF